MLLVGCIVVYPATLTHFHVPLPPSLSHTGKGLQCSRKLRMLRLDSNYLYKLDVRELAGCSQLTTLDLSNNKLDTLAVSLFLFIQREAPSKKKQK